KSRLIEVENDILPGLRHGVSREGVNALYVGWNSNYRRTAFRGMSKAHDSQTSVARIVMGLFFKPRLKCQFPRRNPVHLLPRDSRPSQMCLGVEATVLWLPRVIRDAR